MRFFRGAKEAVYRIEPKVIIYNYHPTIKMIYT